MNRTKVIVNPFYGMFDLAIGVLFLIIACFMLVIVKQNFHTQERATLNSLVLGVLLTGIVGGYYTIQSLIIYNQSLAYSDPSLALEFVQEGFYKAGLFPYPMASYILFFIPMILLAIGVYWLYMRNKTNTEVRHTTTNTIDFEVSRKVFHIGLIGILVCYITIGDMVINNIYGYLNLVYSSERYPGNIFIPYNDFDLGLFTPYMGQTMILFAFMTIFLFVLMTDFIRIYEPKYYLLKTISNSWRASEEKTFGPHIYIILGCMIPALFFPPPIAAAAIGMAALGDGTATIIGITKGKHRIRPSSKKTWEGCIGGFIGSFIFGLMCYIAIINLFDFYGAFYQGSVPEGLIICLLGATAFFMIDYLNPPISDNLLNPVVCSVVMYCISLLII